MGATPKIKTEKTKTFVFSVFAVFDSVARVSFLRFCAFATLPQGQCGSTVLRD
jgi:hypothetical protein